MIEPLSPVELALSALLNAEDAREAARLDLDAKLADAFPSEHQAVLEFTAQAESRRLDLVEAIGAHGALKAEDNSPVGWASYTGAIKKRYATPEEFRTALKDAGLGMFTQTVITEAVNEKAVDQLMRDSGQAHALLEPLVKVDHNKPALRYGRRPGKKKAPGV